MQLSIYYTLFKSCWFWLFWYLLWVLYPKHVSQLQGLKNIQFFQILLFLTPVWMYCVHWLLGKKQPFLFVFLYKCHIYLWMQVPPSLQIKSYLNTILKGNTNLVANIYLNFCKCKCNFWRCSVKTCGICCIFRWASAVQVPLWPGVVQDRQATKIQIHQPRGHTRYVFHDADHT